MTPDERLVTPGERLVRPGERLVKPDERLVTPDELLMKPHSISRGCRGDGIFLEFGSTELERHNYIVNIIRDTGWPHWQSGCLVCWKTPV